MRVFRVFCLLIWPAAVFAQQSGAPGDYAGFNRFPDSSIAEYRRTDNTVYRLPLGRMQRVDGQVAPSNSNRMTGNLRRITYRIPEGFTAEDAFEHFSEQLLESGQAALFECEGRGCGSSNYWANDVFDNRVLYGPVEGQFYLAAAYRSTDGGRPVSGYAALYTVTRGNRQVYAHLDFLELPEGADENLVVTAAAVRQQLEQSNAAIIPRLTFGANDELEQEEGVELILDVLQRDTLLEVYIVSHLREPGVEMAELMERSAARAESIVQRLVEAGVSEDRVSAYGAGPVAPWCRTGNCSERVELVRQP